MKLIYLSHPESAVDPAVPVPAWGLAPRGVARATALGLRWPFGQVALWSSPETKAQDCAHILGAAAGLPVLVLEHSGEVDRSATGYLPHAAHEALADRLFAAPLDSAGGWERAVDAQNRILAALTRAVDGRGAQDCLMVGHGGVGALLWAALCRLPISRALDQPRQGCGWRFDLTAVRPLHDWHPFEAL